MHPSAKKSEEIQHVIDKMPSKFGRLTTFIVTGIIIITVGLGWFIRYPDVSTGNISINANSAKINLVSNSSGKLKLFKANQFAVSEGSIVGLIDNSAEFSDVLLVDSILEDFDGSNNAVSSARKALPSKVSLGELNPQYYTFINSLQAYINYYTEDFYTKQEKTMLAMLSEQNLSLGSAQKRAISTKESLNISKRNHSRDSILYNKSVSSVTEFDRSRQDYLSAENINQSTENEINNVKQQIYNTTQQLQEIAINKRESEKRLFLELSSAYNDLHDNIKAWKAKYLFISPISGRLQYLKFLADNKFILQGEEIFAIVPQEDEIFGEVTLPASGAGKVTIGQEVIIKLDNYPYYEYGSIKGLVKNISLVSNVQENSLDRKESYLLTVTIPDGLITNYGYKLDFKYEIKGTADVVTRDRRLIQRMFDSVRYLVNK